MSNLRKSRQSRIHRAFNLASEHYAELGVDTSRALQKLQEITISLHCWQGDDVRGFENSGENLNGGLAVTGNHPGKARNPLELRADLEKALSVIPGNHRVNLHASYGEFGDKKVDRDAVAPEHFSGWIEWAKKCGLGLDFNPTYFAHPKAADGFTLAHRDRGIREFWIEHGIRCREIGAVFGKKLGTTCVVNFWIPDGYKDTPADRNAPRQRLKSSLDSIFQKKWPARHLQDSLEPKLFGLGSESYVVGSHEFYLGYALTRKKMICLDSGHFHPTECVADKISSLMQFMPKILLHVSRGVRWDSDHVVTLDDDLLRIAREIVANDFIDRVHLGLDYFDGSINRVASWTIGTRNLQRALLMALLEPTAKLRCAEDAGDHTSRLALQEEIKTYPAGAVWDYFCLENDVPFGTAWIEDVQLYQRQILDLRV